MISPLSSSPREIELVPGRFVGLGHPAFFLAEAGINHNGDVEIAKQLIRKAKQCGADCIKFQKRTTQKILVKAALDAPYVTANAFAATYGEHRDFLEFGEKEWRELVACAKEVGIPLTASAWDEDSVDFLERVADVPFYKVASADLTNVSFVMCDSGLYFSSSALAAIEAT